MSNQNAMYAFGLSFAISSVFTAILVIAKETNEPLMSWMKAVSGHHWVTHGVLTLTVFVAVGLILTRLVSGNEKWLSANGLALTVGAAIVASGLIILGFFLAHV